MLDEDVQILFVNSGFIREGSSPTLSDFDLAKN